MMGFNYFKLGLWSLIYYFKPSDIVFDIIVNNIKQSGPILIKLVQWVLPKIETIYDINKETEWFNKLEEVYENCEFHSLEHTKKKYKKSFNSDFDKYYQGIEPIASGSIGQVYKITDKKGEVFAMKVLHPNINVQIHFFNVLFFIIKMIPPLHNYLNYYFPVDLHSFINDFKISYLSS